MYIYIYIHICLYLYMYMLISIYMSVYLIFVNLCFYTYMLYVYTYTCTYIFIYVHTYLCVYIQICAPENSSQNSQITLFSQFQGKPIMFSNQILLECTCLFHRGWVAYWVSIPSTLDPSQSSRTGRENPSNWPVLYNGSGDELLLLILCTHSIHRIY